MPPLESVRRWCGAGRSEPEQGLGEAYPDAQTLWSVTFHPTHFDRVVHHWLYVYARSAVTGEETMLAREFNIVQK